jgi:hypothetical protein
VNEHSAIHDTGAISGLLAILHANVVCGVAERFLLGEVPVNSLCVMTRSIEVPDS